MCGLIGMAGNDIEKKDLDIFKDLFMISALRGTDSSGLAAIRGINTESPKITLTKSDATPDDFAQYYLTQGYPEHTIRNQVVIGHTRSATKGSINKANAHPFMTQNYVGAHNGTLMGKKWVHPKMTDSEMMFREMDKQGIESVLNSLTWWDAYAVTIWDKVNRKLIIARNDQRSLYTAFNKNRGVMYWASELCFLHLAMSRHKQEADYFDMTPDKVFTIEVNDIIKGNHTPWVTQKIENKDYPVGDDVPWENYRQYGAM